MAAEKLEAPEIELDAELRKIVNVRSCSTLRLLVAIRGRPDPVVKWSKAEGPLNERAHIEVTSSYTDADFVSLSWQPPLYRGGCEVDNYVIEKRDATSSTWQTVSATMARTSIKICRLTQGTEYQFRVAAENRYGKSNFVDSEPVVAQYPFEPPGPPASIHVANASKSVMLVEWSQPESDGGSPVTGYHIEYKDQSSILWIKLNRIPLTENQLKVTSIQESLIYEFRVCAENMAGVGPCSKASEPVLLPRTQLNS
uniref:Fibronectin type-III domain-containing protein n=1 Tax=Gadus morhua TaxID=8049 RepID=A0A8C5FG69_GADMO